MSDIESTVNEVLRLDGEREKAWRDWRYEDAHSIDVSLAHHAPLLAREVQRLTAERDRMGALVERYRAAYAGAIDALEYGLAAQAAFVHADDATDKHHELKATLDAGIRDLATQKEPTT